MAGVGKPAVLVPPNTEPHSFQLRPSQMAALARADLVFAVGVDMEPWLARVVRGLPDGRVIRLGELPSVAPLALNARGFDGSARPEGDPHLWLDPEITALWARRITAELVRVAPENTALFQANLAGVLGRLQAISADFAAFGAQLRAANIRLVTSHDAYQYLERRLGLPYSGSLSDITGNRAGARSLSRISRLTGAVCLIIDPNEPRPATLLPDAARVEIDPLGAKYSGQPEFTFRFYRGIMAALETCLSP